MQLDKLLHGGDYNPEQWLDRPDILAKDVELMEKAHVNVVTLGVFSWSTLEPQEGEFHLDWLADIIHNLYAHGISTILATPSAARPAWLAQMGLSDRAGHYPHQLSGGQQQRVAIARALALHPYILCCDEPTSALDPELTGEVLRVLRDLAEHKTTMIIVTHEMKFARDVADRILFMDGGVVVEQGDAKQVIDHPQEERTRKFLASYGK